MYQKNTDHSQLTVFFSVLTVVLFISVIALQGPNYVDNTVGAATEFHYDKFQNERYAQGLASSTETEVQGFMVTGTSFDERTGCRELDQADFPAVESGTYYLLAEPCYVLTESLQLETPVFRDVATSVDCDVFTLLDTNRAVSSQQDHRRVSCDILS